MKKQIVTLNINNYEPGITCYTMPLIEKWAKKMGAEFNIIDKPVFNEKSVTYEKFQLYEKSIGYDWTVFIDADTLVHPDVPDWTEMIGKEFVCFNGIDLNINRFRANDYTRRSKSLYGACTWLVMFSDWCRDLWHPMQNTTFEECMENIQPTVLELLSGVCDREHLIDDYLVTQNIARYGLKLTTVTELCNNVLKRESHYYHHLYACSVEHKINEIKRTIGEWKL